MSKKLIASAGVVASLAVALAPLATFATNSYYPNTHQDRLSVTIEEVCSFGHTYANGDVVHPGSHTDGTGLGSPAETGTEANTPTTGINAGKSYGHWMTDGVDGNDDGDYEDDGDTAPAALSVATAYDTQDTTSNPNVPSVAPTNTTVLTDTAYGVMETNTVNNTFAKTTLAIICNTSNGYKIIAEPDANLVKTANTDPIPFVGNNAMTSATSSAYNFYATDTTTTADTDITSVNSGVSTAGAGGAIEVAKNAYGTALADTGIIATQNGATSTLGDRLTITYGVAVDANQEAGTYQGVITYTLVQL
ncbi:hypothetical protein IJG20_01830 [Candidatus Saccharibacteria bacterium]|nr:hypothetical protein [Candidatus Saccharibacteria bacterium]